MQLSALLLRHGPRPLLPYDAASDALRQLGLADPASALADDGMTVRRDILRPLVDRWTARWAAMLLDLCAWPASQMLSARDALGRTPLDLAAESGNAPATALLASRAGAAPSSSSLSSSAPSPSSSSSSSASASALPSSSASSAAVLSFVSSRTTPLHSAALLGYADAVRALLRAGADPAARDAYGRTPRDVAVGPARAVFGDAIGRDPMAPRPRSSDGVADAASYDTTTTTTTTSTTTTAAAADEDAGDAPTIRWPRGALPIGGAAAVASAGSGGFRVFPAAPWAANNRCDVAVRDGSRIDGATFVRDFVSLRRPVLLRGLARDWPALREWTMDALRAHFGAVSVAVGTIPYAADFARPARRVRLDQYLAYLSNFTIDRVLYEDPLYLFDNEVAVRAPALLDRRLLPLPLPIITAATGGDAERTDPVQWMLGPPLSGSPAHFHAHAWNACVVGAKRWFLYPAYAAFYSVRPPVRFAFDPPAADAQRPLECIQRAGDVIYVPEDFGHAVLNLHDTMAVAQEFAW